MSWRISSLGNQKCRTLAPATRLESCVSRCDWCSKTSEAPRSSAAARLSVASRTESASATAWSFFLPMRERTSAAILRASSSRSNAGVSGEPIAFLHDATLSVGFCASGNGRSTAVGLPSAVGAERGERPALAHAHRAVLELGDLPEGIERIRGEQVRRRLVVGERDEGGLAGRAVVGARRERGLAAARLHRDDVARACAEGDVVTVRSEEHTSELQSRVDLVCRLLLEKKKNKKKRKIQHARLK